MMGRRPVMLAAAVAAALTVLSLGFDRLYDMGLLPLDWVSSVVGFLLRVVMLLALAAAAAVGVYGLLRRPS